MHLILFINKPINHIDTVFPLNFVFMSTLCVIHFCLLKPYLLDLTDHIKHFEPIQTIYDFGTYFKAIKSHGHIGCAHFYTVPKCKEKI